MIEILAAAALAASVPADEPVQQLRIYELFEGNKAAFHARFRDHGMRIMRRHGFDVVAMWEAKRPERTEFVYVLRWPDETAMKTRWATFMADAEWSEIKRRTAAEHGRLVGAIEDRTLRITDYSPPLPSALRRGGASDDPAAGE